MSMSGQRRLELERERVEALRLTQVRAECTALADACAATIRGVRDVAVQQFAAAEISAVAKTLDEARRQIAGDADAAMNRIREIQLAAQRAIARGEAQARAWSEAQAEAVARARAAAAGARAVVAASQGFATGAQEAERLASEAEKHAEAGRIDEAGRSVTAADERARAATAGAIDERVRREVVRGLLGTLKDMGFVVVGPRLDEGVVVLEGRLASGRRARFEVKLDGQMAFDLDGYEGRSCADEMQKVEVAMRDRFGVKLGPPQVVWKNPDRLSKGARDLPAGGRSKGR